MDVRQGAETAKIGISSLWEDRDTVDKLQQADKKNYQSEPDLLEKLKRNILVMIACITRRFNMKKDHN